MKVRIRGQSIRFRLTRSEVADLAAGGSVVNKTVVGPGRTLTFALQSDVTADQVAVTQDGDAIVIALPADQAESLANSDVVGIDSDLLVTGDTTLRVLIEKDFKCIDNASGEPQDDAFPNPSAVC